MKTENGLKEYSHVIIIGFCIAFLAMAFSFSFIWVELFYDVDCLVIEKFNEDIWYQQLFEVTNIGMISGFGQAGNSCSILFDSSILTHIRISLMGFDEAI